MAKLYGEIAAKALLTLDKSFARANGQPLDASEVYYSKAAAETYAATAQAYIGQKIVVIENGVVTHYSVEDTAGTLKELGSKPVADGTTVAIDESGKITLANITEAEATGTYNAVLVNGKLTWVKPSETTVEGLSDLIQALTGRVDDIEDAIGVASAEGVEATGLHKKIEDEVIRALAAEQALGERIDAIDFVDEDELAKAISDARTLISAEIDEDVKVAKDRADEAYTLAESKVDSTTYATDKKAIEDEASAIREIAEGARDSLNTFLTSEDIDDTVNTLKEIQAEIEKMTDATELATALASKADISYVDDELAKKQDVIAEGTYDAFGSAAAAEEAAKGHADSVAATAKSEAIEEAATAAAGLYATIETANGLEDRIEALEGFDHSVYATVESVNNYKTEVAETYATKDELNATNVNVSNNTTKLTTIEEKIEEITSVGGEPNTIEYVAVNGVKLTPSADKTVDVIVPTKFSDLTDDSGFTQLINANATGVAEAKSAANAAQSAANQAQSEVDALEITVGTLQSTVDGHTTSIGDHGTRIGLLEQADATHATEYSELKTIVTNHTTEIAKKADNTALDAAIARIAVNEGAIKSINEVTIPGVNAEIAKKANSADVYTKSEIGTPDEGKTIVQMIADAKSEATYDDTEIKESIQENKDAIATLNGTVDTAGSVLYVSKAQAELAARNEVSALVGAAPEALNTLEEIAKWIAEDETGTTALVDRVIANEGAIAAINNADTGILALAKEYTDTKIGEIPVADEVSIQAKEGVLSVKAISTDLLVQGENELILNGGTAV